MGPRPDFTRLAAKRAGLQISIQISCSLEHDSESDKECVGAAVAAGALPARGQGHKGWNGDVNDWVYGEKAENSC